MKKMPVRFESASEYNRQFHGPLPAPSDRHAVAGLQSQELGIVFDPPIQRRKRPAGAVHSSQMFDNAPAAKDDYVLIGDQSKFAPSIKYTLPKKDRLPVESRSEPAVENGHSYSSGARSPPDAPRPVENDDSYKRKPSNYIPRPTRPSMKAKNHVLPKKSKSEPLKPLSVPPIPTSEHKKPAKVTKAPAFTSAPPAPAEKQSQPPPKPEHKPATKPGHYREKRKGQMNEFVQTDLSKGVADSGQEAPNDYAMKYRAGIAPPRPHGPKRLSEYQMEFKWKKGLNPSPLLAAEQIIYNSNPHLAPYNNPAVMPKTTEYKAAFKEYVYKPVPVEKGEGTPAKKAKIKRSKSLEGLTPDHLHPAGVHSAHRSEEDKRQLRESQNPTRIFFPHGRTKNVHSEYASNFKAPTGFSYEDGAWRGADPPHIQPRRNPIPVDVEDGRDARNEEKASHPSSSWYQEVMELRNRAAEYKQRAQGTHFSRQHLAQLYAQQSELWDTVSNSSTLSALSLESAIPRPSKASKKHLKPKDDSPRESVASTVTTTSTSASSVKEKPGPKKQPKKAWTDEQSSSEKSTMTESASPDSASTLMAENGSEEGRVPTPKFRKDPNAEYKWRHHLDRTTPAWGGALLTSPSQKKSKAPTGTRSEPTVHQDNPEKSTAQVSSSWAGPVQTHGLPTRDSHVLVDEEASTDRTLPTKYTQSPNKPKENRPREFHLMPTLKETLRELKDTNSLPEDDVLSLSARSVASSCSLASEVLERARHRRDEFWGKSSKKQTRS